jgi:hypothetical protein
MAEQCQGWLGFAKYRTKIVQVTAQPSLQNSEIGEVIGVLIE